MVAVAGVILVLVAMKLLILPVPLATSPILVLLFVYIFAKFGDLTGASGTLGVALPSLVIVAAIIGYLSAGSLERRDPVKFSELGRNT